MADVEPTHGIVSRKDAIAAGLRFYFLGEPCRNGHIDQRRVASGACKQCEYLRTKNWRASNKDHVRAHANSYRKENAERFREQERARYAKDPAKYVEKTKRSYWKKPEEYRAKSNKFYHESYRDPDVRRRAQERSRIWALENPERAKASRRNAKIKRRNLGTEGSHTAEDIKDILRMQRGKCAYCRIRMGDKYTADHIVAVTKGGTNDRRNIQLTCMPCNREKWARDPLFHARTLGMLL